MIHNIKLDISFCDLVYKNVDYVTKVYPPSDPKAIIKSIKNMEEHKHEV